MKYSLDKNTPRTHSETKIDPCQQLDLKMPIEKLHIFLSHNFGVIGTHKKNAGHLLVDNNTSKESQHIKRDTG